MARKLTKQQQVRIAHRRSEQQAHWIKGSVAARFVDSVMLKTTDNTLITAKMRQSLGDLVVGDLVLYSAQGNEVIIESIQTRRNQLTQPINAVKSKTLVANIDQLMIVCAIKPKFDLLMLDTFIIACELNDISPVIVLNKMDLLADDSLLTTLAYYEKLNYPIFYTDALTGKGIDALQQQCRDKTSALVGPSGVGKSSLTNVFIPSLNQQTKALTQAGCGSHTTSTAHLFELPDGGQLIDCPGLREFILPTLNVMQLHMGFKEFLSLSAECKFRNCTHSNEPHCAIKESVQKKVVLCSRLKHFHFFKNK
jgi:ribosome biogenesis GTPase / thiamine phosphate phosphatase